MCKKRLDCKDEGAKNKPQKFGSTLNIWYRHFLAMEIGKYVTEDQGDDAIDICKMNVEDFCDGFL